MAQFVDGFILSFSESQTQMFCVFGNWQLCQILQKSLSSNLETTETNPWWETVPQIEIEHVFVHYLKIINTFCFDLLLKIRLAFWVSQTICFRILI